MKIHKTKKMITDSLIPTSLDIQRILSIRSKTFTNKEKYLLDKLEAGAAGERKVLEFIKEFGEEHWVILHNIWMNLTGEQEYDIILITRHACYIFEVKNYSHLFSIENSICKINGHFMDKHIVTQTVRCKKNLKQILQNVPGKFKVHGVLVFIGEHSRIQIEDPINDIDIVLKNELRDYIQMIAQEEKAHSTSYIDSSKIIETLERFSINNPYPAQPNPYDKICSLRKGIHCGFCHNLNIKISKNKISCVCGYIESKEEAVIRTICEYGALNFTSALKKKELKIFMNNQVSDHYLRKVLDTHFIKVSNFSHTYYVNYKLPYYRISSKFNLAHSFQLIIENKNLQSTINYLNLLEKYRDPFD